MWFAPVPMEQATQLVSLHGSSASLEQAVTQLSFPHSVREGRVGGAECVPTAALLLRNNSSVIAHEQAAPQRLNSWELGRLLPSFVRSLFNELSPGLSVKRLIVLAPWRKGSK